MNKCQSNPTSILGGYELIRKVGEGSFSKVFLCKKICKENGDDGVFMAMKLIPKSLIKSTKLQSNLSNEISIMKNAVHVNIAKLNETFTHGKYIILVMDYVSGGDLSMYIRRRGHLKEHNAVAILFQLTQGLLYLETQGIIHRDLKPQNLLLSSSGDNPLLKICDFGFARHLSDEASVAQTPCGTPLYCAPEVFLFQDYDGRADVWSVGVIFFEMLIGRTPFYGTSPRDLFHNIQKYSPLKLPLPVPKDGDALGSQESGLLILRMLEKDPQNRATLRVVGEDVQKLASTLCGDLVGLNIFNRSPCIIPQSATDSWTLVSNQDAPAVRQVRASSEPKLLDVTLADFEDSLYALQVLVQKGDDSIQDAAAYAEQSSSGFTPRSSLEVRNKSAERATHAASLYVEGLHILQKPCNPLISAEVAFSDSIKHSLLRIFEQLLSRLRSCGEIIEPESLIPSSTPILEEIACELRKAAEIERHKGNKATATNLTKTALLLLGKNQEGSKEDDCA